ncbi:MAG: AraC family transcriptional regulator [Steroidobacteraceae bacterium]
MASIQRLSTAAVAPSARLAFWNDLWAHAERPIVVDAEPEGFEGVLTRLCADELEITSVKSTPLIARTGTSTTVARADEKTFTLQVVCAGRCRLRHANTETLAGVGDLMIVNGSKHYELAFQVPVHGLVLSLPWPRFKGYAEKLEAVAGRRIDVIRGPGAVLSAFIRSAWEHIVEGGKGDWPDSAAEVLWDLLTSILSGETGYGISRGRAEDLRCKAKALVDGELSDPAFCSTSVAEALGVSARYLQRVFAEIGITPSRFLIERRLEAAAGLLRQLDGPCSVTDVALQCGFSDLSYFSRAFRCRFGRSPSEYRLNAGAGSSDGSIARPRRAVPIKTCSR